MAGLGGLDNSTCKKILDLLEASYLRFGKAVIKRITIVKFGVDNRGGNGGGCFDKVRTDAVKLTNMIIAGFGDR